VTEASHFCGRPKACPLRHYTRHRAGHCRQAGGRSRPKVLFLMGGKRTCFGGAPGDGMDRAESRLRKRECVDCRAAARGCAFAAPARPREDEAPRAPYRVRARYVLFRSARPKVSKLATRRCRKMARERQSLGEVPPGNI
jgi:hypothetical protein